MFEVKAGEKLEDFLKKLDEIIVKHLEGEQQKKVSGFAREYYQQFYLDDIAGRKFNDIYGVTCKLWDFLNEFDHKKPKIYVFNPTLEEDGWMAGHTLIWVLQRDMPFLINSIRIELARQNIAVHSIHSNVMNVKRDDLNQIVDFSSGHAASGNTDTGREALICIEVGRRSVKHQLVEMQENLAKVLHEVDVIASGYQPICEYVSDIIAEFSDTSVVNADKAEVQDLLKWLLNDHFTFLGYQYLGDSGKNVKGKPRVTPEKQLGLFNMSDNEHGGVFTEIVEADKDSSQLLSIVKSQVKSRVHRWVYPYCIVIKKFDEQGAVIGRHCLLGLFTAKAYDQSAFDIPVVRVKALSVLERANLPVTNYDRIVLRRILETFPRDLLFLIPPEELFDTAMGVLRIQERRKVRLFVHEESLDHFVSCLVYIPRELYKTEVRKKIEKILSEAYGAKESEFSVWFSESVLARAYFVFKVEPESVKKVDYDKIEDEVIEVASAWSDQFEAAAVEMYGEEKGLAATELYAEAFSSSYQEHYEARNAVLDVMAIGDLHNEDDIAMSFYQHTGSESKLIRFKLFHSNTPLELSDVFPVLESHGLRVVSEYSYPIRRSDKTDI